MPLLEDDVKTAMHRYLLAKGFINVDSKMGTRQGHDVEGTDPKSGEHLVIECKGEAATGSQHARSWGNVASAVLTSLNESEDPSSTNRVGIALPDTPAYRERTRFLKDVLARQKITMFWVTECGEVKEW